MAACAVSTAAETATASASGTTASASSATASSTGAASAVTTTIGTTISAAFRATVNWGASGYGGVAVEVGFVVGEIGAAFDGQRRGVSGFTAAAALSSAVFGWKFAAAHFCALFLQDGFAR